MSFSIRVFSEKFRHIPHISMWGTPAFLRRKPRPLDKRAIARFCSQFQILLASGVPLLESLQIIKRMLKREELDSIILKLSEGSSLAEAMRCLFPTMVVSSIESAERAGNLEEVLGRLSKYYEERAEMEEKIKSALIYPSFVVTLCLASLIVLLVFVLPGFKSLFSDLDADLPLFTQIIIGFGEGFSKVWYVPVFVCSGLGIYIPRYRKTEQGAMTLDRLILKLRFVYREQIIQSFRTLGSLLRGGIPIVQALTTTANSSKNRAFQNIILEIKRAIEDGEKLSVAFAKYEIFPQEAIQMIAVGENSGTLAEMLLSIANFYEKEREVFIKRFTTMLEPALTLIVGLVVGIIAIAMFLPMINMISKLQ
ncbi:type II secretion system F family protein [Candidatus Margulisiibacteriota bacterium]